MAELDDDAALKLKGMKTYIAGEDFVMGDYIKEHPETGLLVHITYEDYKNKDYLGSVLRNITKDKSVEDDIVTEETVYRLQED